MENEINRWTAEMKIVNKGNLIAIGDVTLDRVIKIKKVKVLSLKNQNGDELILIELPRQKITKEGKTIWHSVCRTLTSQSRKNLEKAVMDSLKTELAKDLFVNPEIIVHVQAVRNKGNLKAYAKIEYDGIFEISDLRILQGSRGLFVAYPEELTDKGAVNLIYPETSLVRELINHKVLEAYNEKNKGKLIDRREK